MTFKEFMSELHSLYLPPDWEEDLRHAFMGSSMESGTFWDYASKVQNQNILLTNTNSHLPDDKLRHQLEVGMTDKLARKCKAEKLQEIEELRTWLLEVKRVDDAMRADCQELFEELAKTARAESRKGNPLGEPSQHNNIQGNPNRFGNSTNVNHSNTTASSSMPRTHVPKLTEDERSLLYNNQGCLKCRRFHVDHKMANCPIGFPNPAKYKTLTQADADRARPQTNRVAAAVQEESPEADDQSSAYPVSATFSTSCYPIAYMPPNDSSILQRGADSSSDDSVSTVPRAVVGAIPTPEGTGGDRFFAPHIMWPCTMAGPALEFPRATLSMLDTGCPTVLIREDLVANLGLHHRLLPKPESFEVALQDPKDKKEYVTLKEWCKITVSDPSSSWHSKSIQAIIAPCLCTEIILGLTFMACNTIVVDVAACTAIDKTSGFDLLNPTVAKPP
jgi:hypothetical protein